MTGREWVAKWERDTREDLGAGVRVAVVFLVDAAIAQERERCAVIADTLVRLSAGRIDPATGREIGAEIRNGPSLRRAPASG